MLRMRNFSLLLLCFTLYIIPGPTLGYRTRRQATCPSTSPCKPLLKCPSMLSLLQRRTRENIKKLRDATCVFDRRNPSVCCPSEEPTTPPTAGVSREDLLPKSCGHSVVDNKIVGGRNASLGAYPWIVILGYGSPVEWQCGGALINNRYVLTASHCTLAQYTGYEGVDIVRLGEHNLDSSRDCDILSSGQRCADPVKDVRVESIVRHPDFNKREPVSDDIALLRLQEEVRFTPWIQPVCLPNVQPSNVIANVRSSNQVIVAGWGITDTGSSSKILQEVDVPFVDKATCQKAWDGVNLLPEQICFGGVDGKDSCNGDSGGPLVHPKSSNSPPYDLIALVSYGSRRCGQRGVPAVYSNVASYRPWVLRNIRP